MEFQFFWKKKVENLKYIIFPKPGINLTGYTSQFPQFFLHCLPHMFTTHQVGKDNHATIKSLTDDLRFLIKKREEDYVNLLNQNQV